MLQGRASLWIHISISFLEPTEVERQPVCQEVEEGLYAINGQMWTFLGEFLKKAKTKTQVVVSQEWLEFNDLWNCPVYRANSECLCFQSRFDRCRFITRFREWKAYRIQSTWQLDDVLCNHDRHQHAKIGLFQSGFYPPRLAEYDLKQALSH